MCQEILWKTNDTFLMRDRWSDGQSFDTFHIPHKLHWCQIQNMHACIRHASTFFKSFVYKVHASLTMCVPQSLRNSAIAFKHTCIKLEQITNLWVIAIKVLCDSICQRCTGLFNFKNPEKCRWMNQLSYICTFYTWSHCSSALLAMSESTSILFSWHLSKYNVTEHWIITTQTDRTKKHEWHVKVCAHVSRGGGWGVVLKMRLCIYYIRQKQKCEYRVTVMEKWAGKVDFYYYYYFIYIYKFYV